MSTIKHILWSGIWVEADNRFLQFALKYIGLKYIMSLMCIFVLLLFHNDILSFTHSHLIQNLYDLVSSAEHKVTFDFTQLQKQPK